MKSKVSVLAYLILGAAIGMWLYLRYLTPSPLKYVNVPFPVMATHVKAGDFVTIHISRCNMSKDVIAYTITRSIISVDGVRRIELPDRQSTLHPGCESRIANGTQIPKDLSPGYYYLEGTAEIDTLFKHHTSIWATVPFYVE